MYMEALLQIVQTIISVLLIIVILLQHKGAGLGAGFGGGGGGPVVTTRRGVDLFLHKITIGLAVVFFVLAFIGIFI